MSNSQNRNYGIRYKTLNQKLLNCRYIPKFIEENQLIVKIFNEIFSK